MQNIQIILVLLLLSGFIFSLFIYSKTPKFCRKGENCDLVIGSKYGKIFGIDLSLYGALYYLINLFLSISLYFNLFVNKNDLILLILAVYITIGFVFSIYLLFIQLFVIKKVCKKCMIVFFVNLFLLITLNFLF